MAASVSERARGERMACHRAEASLARPKDAPEFAVSTPVEMAGGVFVSH